MDLYLLIERTTNNENEWTLRGIFDSEQKALNASVVYMNNCSYAEDFEDKDGDGYFTIKKIECNKLNNYFDGYLCGYNGIPDDHFFEGKE